MTEESKPQRYASWTAGKLPLPELAEMKRRGDKIVMVTAYDAPSGRLADAAGVDLILVGDSAGMVVHGRESTVPVSLDEIVFMTQWVTRGAKRPLVIADMPFGSYEEFERAGGAQRGAAREGGRRRRGQARARRHLGRARARDRRGRHPGDGPRRPHAADGHRPRRLQGTGPDGRPGAGNWSRTRSSSRRRAASRSCSRRSARRSRARSRRRSRCRRSASARAPETDGQVLVWHDMLGFYEGRAPRFVKRYAELGEAIVEALERYAEDVRSGSFPEERHTYAMPPRRSRPRSQPAGRRVSHTTVRGDASAGNGSAAARPSPRARVQSSRAPLRTPTRSRYAPRRRRVDEAAEDPASPRP